MPKIETESDALLREYARLSRQIDRLARKYSVQLDGYWPAQELINEIFERMGQIVKELEGCTGISYTDYPGSKK